MRVTNGELQQNDQVRLKGQWVWVLTNEPCLDPHFVNLQVVNKDGFTWVETVFRSRKRLVQRSQS
jgi:hypothetical protein